MPLTTLLDYWQHTPLLYLSAFALLGLIVGSFLNVVIYRLPIMLQKNWTSECIEYLQDKISGLNPAPLNTATFNLAYPPSHCPQCQHRIRFWQNIPVLSYLLLKGHCHHCQAKIAIRYPLIELFCALLTVVCASIFPFGWGLIATLVLTWSLMALSFIDLDHQLLPDQITGPLLWLGIMANYFDLWVSLQQSVIGAVAGYLFLWSVYWLFKLLTHKEGMGYGDFKLLALLGAWLGWQALPGIVLLSSLCGAVFGLMMILSKQLDRNTPIPFGPYLAVAGWASLLWGTKLNHLYFSALGLS